MSQVGATCALLVFVTLTRGLGQSALSIVSLAMVGKWFRRRLTWAMAIYALVMSIGFMIAFPVVGAVVLSQGWRFAWAAIGVVAPRWCWRRWHGCSVRSSPEAIGAGGRRRAAGGRRGGASEPAACDAGARRCGRRRSGCSRSPASLYGLVASGIGLFNESILAERGFAPDVYHTALAVTAITGLAGNFAAGAWADRGSLRHVLLVVAAGPRRRARRAAARDDRRARHGAGGGDGHRRRLRDGRVLQLLGTRATGARISGASRARRRP